jgi:uncharacterized protein
MDPGNRFGRGIAFPPHVGSDGRVQWSDGPENVRESIRIILMTEQQERVMLPEFGGGLRRFLYEPNTTATLRLIQARVTASLERWEPRVKLEDVSVRADDGNPTLAIVTIDYALVASAERGSLTLAVPTGGP